MFIDASALTALMTDEDEARGLLLRLQRDERRLTSPVALWETAVAVSRILGLSIAAASDAVERYLSLMAIECVVLDQETTRLALQAFDRYGKGRHAARLNMGDCFAYATARQLDEPLLFKGGDFSLTDIKPV